MFILWKCLRKLHRLTIIHWCMVIVQTTLNGEEWFHTINAPENQGTLSVLWEPEMEWVILQHTHTTVWWCSKVRAFESAATIPICLSACLRVYVRVICVRTSVSVFYWPTAAWARQSATVCPPWYTTPESTQHLSRSLRTRMKTSLRFPCKPQCR
jgi:hypothetical protein